MSERTPAAFISYSRTDSEFVMRLAEDLKSAGASVWLDQVDIQPGEHWDHAVEGALDVSPLMLVILSSASVNSMNVMDEVSFALEKEKTVIPVVIQDCAIPFRLRRIQYADFRVDYSHGINSLLRHLASNSAAPAVSQDAGLAKEEEAHRKIAADAQAQSDAERQRSELAEAQRNAAQQRDAQEAAERKARADDEARQNALRAQQEHEAAERAAQAADAEDARQKAASEIAIKAASEIKAAPMSPSVPAPPVSPPPSPRNHVAARAYLTALPAIYFLLFKPYNKIPLVRFHAYQSIALNVVAFVLLPTAGWASAYLFLVVALGLFILWLRAISNAGKSTWYKLPVIGNAAMKWAKV